MRVRLPVWFIRLRRFWREAPASARGALWLVLVAALTAVLAGLVRKLSATVHPFEIAFFRNLFGLGFMLPWLIQAGIPGIRTKKLRLYGLRAAVAAVAMLTFFYALSIMPLAEVIALGFTSPLFATAGAALFLGEDVRARRWTATIIGFLGAMAILRPGGDVLALGAVFVLISAAAMAAAALMVKNLSRTEPAAHIVLYLALFMTPLTLVPALFVWTWPGVGDLFWLVLLAAVATSSNVAIVKAFSEIDVSLVAALDFVRLPFVAAIGFVFFAEIPDVWTWIGAAVIAAASIYIAHREIQLDRLRRKAIAAAAPRPPERAQ